MRSPQVQIRLSRQLLKQIDQAAKNSHQTRSDFIRQSIAMRLNSQRLIQEPSDDDFLNSLEEIVKRGVAAE